MPARKTPSTCSVTGTVENGIGKETYAPAPTNAAINAACATYPTVRSSTRSTESVSVLIPPSLGGPVKNTLVYHDPPIG